MFASWALWQIAAVAAGVFLMGMSKGGLRVGSICVPMMVLAWPDQENAARQVVAFMLPLLCVMDLVAVVFYRKDILWERIVPLLPGTVVGVAVASLLFLGNNPVLTLSDRWLKLGVGVIGLGFVAFQLGRHRLTSQEGGDCTPSKAASVGLGLAAGITSTVAHAAGPVAQMYFLPQNLRKMNLAATLIGFFWVLNLIKLLPFGLLGGLQVHNLSQAAVMLPLIPLGVGAGYVVVRLMKTTVYLGFIYVMLVLSSLTLIAKAF